MIAGLLPVNMSAGSLQTSASRNSEGTSNDLSDVVLPSPDDIPKVSDLSMWDQESYQLGANAAGSLGFPMWSVDTDAHAKLILFGVSRYSDVETRTHIYRYGVAIRVLVEILDFEAKAKLDLPTIAAQVQLKDLEASCLLLVSGYVGNISATLPAWQNFDVKSYSEYFAAVTSLQKTIFDDPANMRPVLLGSTLAEKLVSGELSAANKGADNLTAVGRHIFHPLSCRAHQIAEH